MAFRDYDQSRSLPEIEEQILAFWKKEKIFEKSIEQNKKGKPFVFYEGPPTTNAPPGIHHVLSRVYKDIYIRYQSQQGRYVPRRAGWDCHGLPVEREVEKKLGIESKSQIEETVGLEEFNRLCRESIKTYVGDWNRFTERMGFWIDLDDAYFTMDNDYIETVWSLLKRIWEKDLIYRDYKVVPYDPVMGATLSDAEVNEGYRTVKDPSLTVRFRLRDESLGENAFVLVWTTTPWTLPSNTGLAVAPNENYVVIKRICGEDEIEPGRTERLILAEALLEKVLADTPYEIEKTIKGCSLEGLPYERLIDWASVTDAEKGFRILGAEFVTMDTGTGIVHLAPAYGADDLEMGRTHDLPIIHAVGLDGRFAAGTPLAGKFFKDADKEILIELKKRGMVWKSEKYEHEYPFGYRTGAPLLYFAKFAWYIRTTSIRDELLANNKTINWTPDHIQEGRFGRWLENNRDWALSRERYWGTPLPLWTDGDGTDGEGNFRLVGSIQELEKLCGRKLKDLDLHRPHIDAIEFTDPDTGKTMRRVPEVIDCWFDSGAMPYAQWGEPLGGGKERYRTDFPADFITEAIDQTRGWFYTLLAVGTMISGESPYKNVICLGHVVDAKGEKMSKSKGNTVNPDDVFSTHGADALRWYFLTASPPGNSRRVGKPGDSQDPVKNVLPFLRTLMSSVGFFTLYARVDGIKITNDWEHAPVRGAPPFNERPEIDRWILSALQELIHNTENHLNKFDSFAAGRAIEDFTESLSNWYIRRNRRRFWKGELDADKMSAYDTLYRCLITLSRLLAPFVPFLAEDIYRELVPNGVEAKNVAKGKIPASVHLSGWPRADMKNLYDEDILYAGRVVQKTVYLGRLARKNSGHKVRQPLAGMSIYLDRAKDRKAVEKNKADILEELNIKEISFLNAQDGILDYRIKPNLPVLGKRLGKRLQAVRQFIEAASGRELAAKARKGEVTVIPDPEGEIRLGAEDLLIESVSREGTSGVEGDGILVALDIELTPELISEGLIRDLVRNIQELRKKSGLEVTDRIGLSLQTDKNLQKGIQAYQGYIEEETLGTITREDAPDKAAHTPIGVSQLSLGETEVEIRIWKAASKQTGA